MSPIPRLSVRRDQDEVRETGLDITVASSFRSRLVGLLAHRSLDNQSGMLIVPCGGIHTIGMRFPIDVIFLSRRWKVLGYSDGVKPNRFRVSPKGTYAVLEIADGNRNRTGINLDDYLIFD